MRRRREKPLASGEASPACRALDRGDFIALVHHGQAQTGADAPALDVDRARGALSVVAALLRAGQAVVQ